MKTADLRVARRRAVALEAELVTGVYTPALKTVTIADAVVEYMEVIQGNGRKRKTVVKYQGWFDKFSTFGAAGGVMTLQQITPQMFEKFRNECRKTLKGKTISNGLIIIKQLLKWASAGSREYLAKNPLAGCRVEQVRSLPAFTPTPEQVHALINLATGERKLQFAMLAMTGLRAGELAMLRVADVDLSPRARSALPAGMTGIRRPLTHCGRSLFTRNWPNC